MVHLIEGIARGQLWLNKADGETRIRILGIHITGQIYYQVANNRRNPSINLNPAEFLANFQPLGIAMTAVA